MITVTVMAHTKTMASTLPHFRKMFAKNWQGQSFTIAGSDKVWSDAAIDYFSTLDGNVTVLMLDDYLLSDHVDHHKVNLCCNYLRVHLEIGCIRLNPCPGPEMDYSEFPWLGEFSRTQDYILSLQPTVWRVSCLIDLMREGESAHDLERLGQQRARDSKWRFLGTRENLISINNLMRMGDIDPAVLDWVNSQ